MATLVLENHSREQSKQAGQSFLEEGKLARKSEKEALPKVRKKQGSDTEREDVCG